eukprot:Plantae.Rhodophyta-Purpureofilum_apyrenoidigerum.ctg25943.p1 GENE.Plantae.Rhodophyta-Purpureofilum_apyrenoidigerum.ctg25943~~Plantae.Rhodophyta-Purpureofilum_apyrenoidigerum.ctg25943.p1  ORF type:complete len:179 (-),score=31.03 Plantae.Rhodophyta-Purpureofilum_apyrenoidigerum.ctg25943:394-930(-)
MIQFGSPKEALSAGAQSIFARWTALELAVGEQFGGETSASTAGEMFEVALELLMNESKPPSQTTLENLFYDGFDYMNTDVEDDSIEEVSGLLLQLREKCLAQDYTLASTLVEKVKTRTGSAALASIRGEERGDFYGVEQDGPDAPPAPLAREPRPKPEPDIDEEGFITIESGRKHHGV